MRSCVQSSVDIWHRWKLVSFTDYKTLMLRPDKKGRISVFERVRAVASTWFYGDRIAPVTQTELEQSHDSHHAPEIEESKSGH